MGLNVYGILYPPFDAVTLGPTPTGFTAVQKGWNFGTVAAVNYANLKVNVGSVVLFKQEGAVVVTAGGTDYYFIEEDDIIFKGIIPP